MKAGWLLGGAGLLIIGAFAKNKVISMLRTTQDILNAVAEIDPQHNPVLQPGQIDGVPTLGITWCNKFLTQVTTKLGAPIPWLLANDQADWLEDGNGGYFRVKDLESAQNAALQGKIAVAVWHNLNPGGHGHASLILPIPGVPQIAQAGRSNFNQAPFTAGWGAIVPSFFVHN
jgi:hypothetical protein